ncbi:hypothetical protein JTE90_025111 [Oedothorax gibbosus]|uniref:Pyrrolo-quinoline quinone repeat domain-containing protein n=1 Tax=Oedothorax gibbosus TaxID=931172 RepID=A0AAV6U187_9ARAC|nr:hypothetical protein JTE90_025111 [Oedothorax gibbosus]
MGNGCSSVKKVRQRIERSIPRTKKSHHGSNNVKVDSINHVGEDDYANKDEAEDELHALSPSSLKLGSGDTRGVSASSTVLPGTSIIFPVQKTSVRPQTMVGTHSELVAARPTHYGFYFFQELKNSAISSLVEFSSEYNTVLHVYTFGHQSVPFGNDYRRLIRNFIKEILKSELVISLTIFGRPILHTQPPDVIKQTDFDNAVSHMTSADDRETIHCSYVADVNAADTIYRLQNRRPTEESGEEWDAETVVQILEGAFDDDLKDAYITSVFEDILRLFQQFGGETLEKRSILVHLETSSQDECKPKREGVRILRLLADWEDKIPEDLRFNFFNGGGSSWQELWNGDAPSSPPEGRGGFSALESKLRNVLVSIFDLYKDEKKYYAQLAGKGIPSQLRSELLHQQSDIRAHLSSFRDRPDLLSTLMGYVSGSANHPLVVRGRQGRGKSALLAVATVLCGSVHPDWPVLMRAVGASPESCTQEQILRSVCEQLALLYGEHPAVASRADGYILYIRVHLSSFRDWSDHLSSLMGDLLGSANHPLIVRGRQGRGKSALLATATVMWACPSELARAHAGCWVFIRIMHSRADMCEQLALLYGEHSAVASRGCILHIRAHLLSTLMGYVSGSANHPLVVRGRQGRGKNTLLAVATVLCGSVYSDWPVFMRAVGASPESLTQEQILRNVCEQLALLYGEHPAVASRSIGEHNSFFSMLLRRACAERPLVVILDGLDQVEEHSGRSLTWFPTVLPPHVKLVIALREGSNELLDMQDRLFGEELAFLEIPDLEIDETLCIIQHQLRLKNRRLSDTQLGFARICVTDNPYPRYAHVFAHVASSWHTLSVPEQYWSKHSVFDVFCDYITKISRNVSLSKINRFLATMATLKHGMMESEMFDILNSQNDSFDELPPNCCPMELIFLLSHLSFMLRICIRQGHKFYYFKSQLYRKLVKTYLGKEQLLESLRCTLQYISNEENSEQYSQLVAKSIKTNHKHQRWRELEESTNLRIKLNIPVRKYFFDPHWLLQRVLLGDIYMVLEEIKVYKRRNPDDREIDNLRKFLQLSAYSMRLDAKQLYTQLHGRARGLFSDPQSHFKYPLVKKLVLECVSPPVKTFNVFGPCLKTLVDSQKIFPALNQGKEYLERITWLDEKRDSTYVVTYSSSRGEIAGWNAQQTKKMVSMKIEECVVGLRTMGRNADVLVLHQNTLEIVDLGKGAVKTRMTELVDVSQGVHVLRDGKGVLAVSEGRDEILRFCTHSGRVKNRISSGEDRQLDCLLASGDGRVCVSGDLFRKPHTLFAWEVRSGQVRRAFSLKHHEFRVRLSVLDDEGRMIFATAKDLLDSAPTFLLAYDTTTGDVTWEMRPDSNISAVRLCLETERLIVATEDGTIIGLNMHTGEKEFLVCDPSDCVNRIETASNKTFLTWDSETQARCIRVWSTMTGQNIASFTADYNIYDCLYSHEGDTIALILHNKDQPGLLAIRK